MWLSNYSCETPICHRKLIAKSEYSFNLNPLTILFSIWGLGFVSGYYNTQVGKGQYYQVMFFIVLGAFFRDWIYISYCQWDDHFDVTYAKQECLLKGCVGYICTSLFLSLNESTCQTRKNVFYFTSKVLFVLEKIKFWNSAFSNFMTSSNA